MKKLLLILFCLPLFYSCGEKEEMKKEKKIAPDKQSYSFVGKWDVYQNNKLCGSLVLADDQGGEFTGEFTGDGLGNGTWDDFDGENFCMNYWIPNRKNRTIDDKEICYKFKWINKDNVILTKNQKSLNCKKSIRN